MGPCPWAPHEKTSTIKIKQTKNTYGIQEGYYIKLENHALKHTTKFNTEPQINREKFFIITSANKKQPQKIH